MRVLIAHPHLTPGGAEKQVIHLAKYLLDHGFDVAIATLSISLHSLPDFVKEFDVMLPDRRIEPMVRSFRFFDSLGFIKELTALRKLVKDGKHFGLVNPHNFPSCWSTTIRTKPVVWMCNEPPDLWINPNAPISLKAIRNIGVVLDRFIVNKYVDLIAVIDHLNKERVKVRYGRESIVVYSGVDYEFFSRGNGRNMIDRFGLHDAFVLVQVGWVTPQKNQLASIKAVESLKSKIDGIKLVIAGRNGNPYANYLKEYVSKRRLGNHVIFAGFMSEEEIRDLYQASHVVLFPTLAQTWGLSPLEGLCTGKIPIVSPFAGVSEIIYEKRVGIITTDLTSAIVEVYQNYKRYQDLAYAGQQFIKSNLTWDHYCMRMEKLFSLFE